MPRTRVKICGICRVEDAGEAARLGADAIGLVLNPNGRRFVGYEIAEKILADLPPMVTPVGLFVDAPAAEVRGVASRLGLRHVQLHGSESPEMIAELRGLAVLKALPVRADSFHADLACWRAAIARLGLSHLRGLVLESAPMPGGETGGTGTANDWQAIAAAGRAGVFAGLPSIIAAGGLTPINVGEVVRAIRPWAVDVSSGVEENPRQKSHDKIAQFIAAVADADHRL